VGLQGGIGECAGREVNGWARGLIGRLMDGPIDRWMNRWMGRMKDKERRGMAR